MAECIDNAILQQNQFRFVIPRAPNFCATIQEISVPSINLGEAPFTTFPLDLSEPGEKLIFEGINASFLIQANLKNWLELHKWLHEIADPNISDREGYDSLKTDATLQILDPQGNIVVTIIFHDMFPIDLGEIPLSTTSAEPATCAVSLRYSHYEVRVEC